MSKNKSVPEEEIIHLDSDILDTFSKTLENTINTFLDNYEGVDPRMELAVAMGLFAAQISIDRGLDEEEFLELMRSLYKDQGLEEDDELEKDADEQQDKKLLN
jgi:hypothetical protein